ncbi:MAG: enoyl-CoA hydratase-related protein [Acidimicrobiales bacterium]
MGVGGTPHEAVRPLVRRQLRGPVVTLTLDSPKNRNALSARMLLELRGALGEVGDDAGIRVVVLTGDGPAFCSGVDLDERLHPPGGPGATLDEVLSLMGGLRQPVVARVNGPARAGGVGLVAASDLAVAPAAATFAFTEVRVGVAPAVIAVPSLAVMGRRAWTRYALTGDVFGAGEAVEAGLLTAAVPDATALDTWVSAAVASLLRSSPGAVAATRMLADQLGGRRRDDALSAAGPVSERLFASPDAAEGMAAFLEKRSPRWAVPWPPDPGEARPDEG